MDDGLIQMLVVGVFIVISMMEGATRKKRRQAQMTEHPTEAEVDFLQSLTGDEQEGHEEAEGLVPNEIWAEIADLARGGIPPTAEPVPDPEPRLRMDAGLTRAALLSQLGDRFEERSRPLPVSERADREGVAMTPLEPEPLARTEAREEAREVAAATAFHRLHSSNLADRKEDMHYAQTSERSAMLRLFGAQGGRVEELRRAVILSEILGPPVSMREPRES